MDADDDYALRKAQRQMGPHGQWVMVGMILVCMALFRWLGTPPPGVVAGAAEAAGARVTSP